MAISIGEIEATLRLRNEMTPQLQQAIASVKQAGAQIESTLKSASSAFSGMATGGKRSLGVISAELAEAEARVAKYKKAIANNPGSQTVFEAAQQGLTNLLPRVEKLRAEMAAAKREMSGAGDEAVKFKLNMQQLGTSLTSVGRVWTTYVTAPIVAAAGASVAFASQYEKSTTQIHTLSGVTRADMENMRKAMLDLAPAVGIGPEKLAEAMLAVTSTGIKGAAAIDVLTKAAQGSAVGMGDATVIARTLTSIMKAYGESGLTAGDAMEIMFKTVKDGNSDAAQLAGTLGRVVGIASQMGVTFDQVGAFIATFTRLGVGADEAVTSLRGILGELLKPSEKAAEALSTVGLTFDDLRRIVREQGLMQALTDLQERFKGNTEAIAEVFPNIRALAGVMGTAGSQTAAYAEIQKHLADNTHEFSDAMEETKKTLDFKWDSLVAELKVMAIVIGDDLVPKIKSFIDAMMAPGGAIDTTREWIKWWKELPDGVKTFAETLLATFAVGGPVLVALGAVARAISGIQVLLFGANTAAATSVFGALGKIGFMGAVGATGFVVGNSQGTRDISPADLSSHGNGPLPGVGGSGYANGTVLPGVGALNLPGVGPGASGFLAGGNVNLSMPAVARVLTDSQKKALAASDKKLSDRLRTVLFGVSAPEYRGLSNLPAGQVLDNYMTGLRGMGSASERARNIEFGMAQGTQYGTGNFKLPGAMGAVQPFDSAYDFIGPEQSTRERMSGSDVLSSVANSFVQMSQIKKLGPIMQSVGQMFVGLDMAKKANNTFGGRFGVGSQMFSGDASKGEKFAGAIQAGAAIAQGAMDVWNATGAQRTAAGNAGAGAMAGAQAGAAFGPWGMAVGAAAGLVVGIVRGKPEWAKAADDVGRDFGVKVSDELAKSIAKNAKTMFRGDRQASSLYSLDQIIAEGGGVNADNVDRYSRSLRDVFSMLETGKFTAKQAAEVLDKNFGSMVEAGTDKLGFLSQSLREVITLDDRFGTQSKAVSDYLKQQSATATTAASTLVAYGSATAQTAGDLANLGVIAVSTFSAAMASGMSFSEALRAAGPSLDTLTAAFARVGGASDNAALSALMLQSTVLKANPELLAAVGALGDSMVALSNMGMLNVETFAAMQATGITMFGQLQEAVSAAGGTTRDALVPMQEYLQRAAAAAELLGVPLDENIQRMIDQSKELGIWQDKGEDANDQMLDGINRIADAMDRFLGALGLIPGAAAAASSAVNSIPPVPGPRDTRDQNNENNGGAVMHLGGMVRRLHTGMAAIVAHSGLAPDEVPAILQTGESVLNRRGTDMLGSDAVRQINAGRMPSAESDDSGGGYNGGGSYGGGYSGGLVEEVAGLRRQQAEMNSYLQSTFARDIARAVMAARATA